MFSSAGLASLCFANHVRFRLQSGVLFEEADVEILHFAKKYLQLLYGWQDCHSEKDKQNKRQQKVVITGESAFNWTRETVISHNILNSKGNKSQFPDPFYLSGLKPPQNVTHACAWST